MRSFTMNNGLAIPALGYGVFQMSSAEVAEHLLEVIEAGYRHIDTANAYFNEVAVGRVVAGSPVAREDFFVTTKLFPQSYPYAQCGPDIDATLERLGMDYVDLLLLHQPYGEYVAGWRAMEEAVEAGRVRSIGLSNFSVWISIKKLMTYKDLLTDPLKRNSDIVSSFKSHFQSRITIKNGVEPSKWTYENMAEMDEQLKYMRSESTV